MEILALKAEPVYAELLAEAVRTVCPGAALSFFSRASQAIEFTADREIELAIVGGEVPDMDGLDYLPILVRRRNVRRVLVISSRLDARLLLLVRRLEIHGLIDEGTARLPQIRMAIEAVLNNGRYRSPSISRAWSRALKEPHLHILSPREQMVLSVLGSGLDNAQAAELLAVSEHTVRTHRANLMRKLSLPHKGELMRFAVEHRYTRLTGERILFPGHQAKIALTIAGASCRLSSLASPAHAVSSQAEAAATVVTPLRS